MAVEEIHYNDIGTIFELTLRDSDVIVDISSALSMQMHFKKPDGTTVTKTAVHTTDGIDGKMQYTTVDQDLDATGSWKVQGKIQLPVGTWSTDIQSFKVYKNLV